MKTEIFDHNKPFRLESGIVLPGFHLAYHTLGKLNKEKDNVVWIFHALTANSNPGEWWPGLVGESKCFDPARDFIVCVNMPGSCYGSVGPLEKNPSTGQPYYHDFPFFTPRDMIRAYQPLRASLGIEGIRIGIGGSMGGQQLLEWAIEEPGVFEFIFPIATNAFHSPWGKAFNASQRLCIETDPGWKEKSPDAGLRGMKVARGVALLSYRSSTTYNLYQADPEPSGEEPVGSSPSRSQTYQIYQGEKLAKRFNAFSYYSLSQSMDSHQVGRGRGNTIAALKRISSRTLAIGIESDLLFPVREQAFLAEHITHAEFVSIPSLFGHDGFLLESTAIALLVNEFIKKRGAGGGRNPEESGRKSTVAAEPLSSDL